MSISNWLQSVKYMVCGGKTSLGTCHYDVSVGGMLALTFYGRSYNLHEKGSTCKAVSFK